MANGIILDEKLIRPEVEFPPTKVQQKAIDHFGTDLLISAGAGSGKTDTLVNRIVENIAVRRMDISRMLVVTFTKDAANELKVRISEKLSKWLKLNPSNAHLSLQLVKVSSADISTIHSFCLKCLRPYFDKLSLDSDFRIAEDSEIEILKSEAMSEVLDSFYEAQVPDKDFLLVSDCYSAYTDEDVLANELLSLYKKLISTATGLKTLLDEVDPKKSFLDSKYGLILMRRLNRFVNHFDKVLPDIIDYIKTDDVSITKYLPTIAYDYDFLLRIKNAIKTNSYASLVSVFNSFAPVEIDKKGRSTLDTKLITKTKGSFEDEIISLRDGFFYSSEEAIESTIEQNNKICKAMYKVLSAFDEEFKKRKRHNSVCDFNDLERYTMQLFYDENGNKTSIANEISQRYDELYIDEYQDNNSVQDKIFSAISRNNRFMVGDIKQSIYLFRAAEPTIFADYRNRFCHIDSICDDEKMGKSIFMSDNFRCDNSIIETTNCVSDYMFFNSYGFKYVEEDRLIHAKKYKNPITPQNAELCIIDKSKIKRGDTIFKDYDPQAEFVAQEIKRLLDNGKLPNGKPITKKDITILLRATKTHAEKYIEALQRYEINCEYLQEIDFYKKPHILLLLCILNTIDNPSKDIYLAGALHSSIFGFTLDELVSIKKASSREGTLYSNLIESKKENELGKKISDFLEILDKLRKDIRKMGADQAISYILNETKFLSKCKASEKQDIIKIYNLARKYENGSYKGLYSFLRYIENIESKKGAKEKITDDPEDRVRIVTMHSSKGLQYEICFICEAQSLINKGGQPSPILFDKKLGVSGYVGRDEGIVKYDNLIRKCTHQAIKETAIEEAMRLLYVAMTRARSKLYITASVSNMSDKVNLALKQRDISDDYMLYSCNSHFDFINGACPSDKYLDTRVINPQDLVIKPRDGGEEITFKPDDAKVDAYKEILEKRLNTKYDYQYLEKIPSKLSVSTLYPGVLDDEEGQGRIKHSIDSIPKFIASQKSKVSGAERGTATHVFLQFCDFENLRNNGVQPELDRLIKESFISKEIAGIINLNHINDFITSPFLDELLRAKEIVREFRFNIALDAKEFLTNESVADETVLVQGVVDCLYKNDLDEWILVDYKTDAVTEDNYVDVLTEKHTNQLTYYKKACDMMLERPISRVLIYSVPLAKTVELEIK